MVMTSKLCCKRCFVLLVTFSYWSRFHVNVITSSGAMTVFFHKWLTRIPAIWNSPIWVLLNTWGLEKVRDTKLYTNIFNKMLLNTAKYQGYRFYRFCVITEKRTRGGRTVTHPPRLVKTRLNYIYSWKIVNV